MLVFPLADGLRRYRQRLCQLGLGDVLMFPKHLDLGADLLHPTAPFFALPSYPMAVILQTMETERLTQLLVEGGFAGTAKQRRGAGVRCSVISSKLERDKDEFKIFLLLLQRWQRYND